MDSGDFHHSQGIGGRLAAGKSPLYERAVMAVEGRTNRYTARHMLLGDLAYVLASVELGVTPAEAGRAISAAIIEILSDVDGIAASQSLGDIVLRREVWVAERVGRAHADWLHVGRHRAESLRGYLPRMFLRGVLFHARGSLLGLCETLLDKAVPHNQALAPVFHHVQHAGHTTIGEYLTSFATNFAQRLTALRQAEERLDLAPPPLTGRPISVEMAAHVSRSLGFGRVALLRQQLHVTEDQFIEPFSCMVALSVGLARLAEDLRLYSTSEFAFFELDDRHASTSSALPQKKNAFGLQLVIGGAKLGIGRLAAQLATSTTVSDEADSVYHAGSLYQHCDDIIGWIDLIAEIIEDGAFDSDEMARKASWGFAGAAEAQDILVFERRHPPRAAHHVLGSAIRAAANASQENVGRSLRQALEGLPDEEYLASVIEGGVVPKTALNHRGLVDAQTELRALLAEETVRLSSGDPYEDCYEALIGRARVFAGGGEVCGEVRL